MRGHKFKVLFELDGGNSIETTLIEETELGGFGLNQATITQQAEYAIVRHLLRLKILGKPKILQVTYEGIMKGQA